MIRLLVVIVFGAACISSVLWIESDVRKLTQLQKVMLAATAIAGWAITLLVGSFAV